MDRNTLRNNTLRSRDQITPARREQKNNDILQLLTSLPAINDAQHLFIYIHFRSEVETMTLIRQLIAENKTVSVPVTLAAESRIIAVQITDPGSQLLPGYYGISEPTPEQISKATIDPTTLDTVVVPGSVFDPLGGRLGYGGGFYDRFLSKDAPQARRVGLAFALQMVDLVPMEPHDQYMDQLVTEQQIYNCPRNRNA